MEQETEEQRQKRWAKDKGYYREQRKKYRKKWRLTHKKQYTKQNRKKIQIYRKNHPESVIKQNHKRRGLGFIPLNEPFAGSIAHHIDRNFVVYIPEILHVSVPHNVWTGQNMTEINNKTFEWLNNQNGSIQIQLCIEQ